MRFKENLDSHLAFEGFLKTSKNDPHHSTPEFLEKGNITQFPSNESAPVKIIKFRHTICNVST